MLYKYGFMLYKYIVLDIFAYTDANWDSCLYIYIGTYLVSWNSKKHTLVTRSLINIEFKTLTHIVGEVTWIKKVLTKLQIYTSSSPLKFCYHVCAGYSAKHLMLNSRTQHIEIDFHFAREKIIF